MKQFIVIILLIFLSSVPFGLAAVSNPLQDIPSAVSSSKDISSTKLKQSSNFNFPSGAKVSVPGGATASVSKGVASFSNANSIKLPNGGLIEQARSVSVSKYGYATAKSARYYQTPHLLVQEASNLRVSPDGTLVDFDSARLLRPEDLTFMNVGKTTVYCKKDSKVDAVYTFLPVSSVPFANKNPLRQGGSDGTIEIRMFKKGFFRLNLSELNGNHVGSKISIITENARIILGHLLYVWPYERSQPMVFVAKVIQPGKYSVVVINARAENPDLRLNFSSLIDAPDIAKMTLFA